MDEIIVNSHFTSKTDEEIALNMSNIIAKLINRDLESLEDKGKSEESVTMAM